MQEQLIEEVKRKIAVAERYPDLYMARIEVEIFKIALASLTAEPVAWDYEWASCITCEGPQNFRRIIEPEAPPEWAIDEGQARNITPLYRHAKPVPVVPEEKRDDDGNTTSAFDHGWNACRAAMLQGKLLDLSQPVDPQIAEYEQIMLQAGWVMVPVEPTDEMIAAAMECDDVVFDSKDPTAFCVQYREIYCAMVDTAPKQENI
ncbi:hypothetical protein ABGB79_004141 [Salmonella enterica subsp. enterica]